MTVFNQQLREWLNAKKNEHLEFKEAENNFRFEKLVKHCAALANERRGSIVLGISDARCHLPPQTSSLTLLLMHWNVA